MKSINNYSPILKRVSHIFCVIVGLTFIASGFTKAIDPWGTAIKFEEYFSVYGFDFLQPLSRVLAIWLCGAEMMMGLMILFRVRLRLISIFALVSMIIFTIITILSATVLPVEDCGCFGDALYLTPWQTVAKNLIILPMIITIWWRYRPDKILVYKQHEVILATIFCIITMGFSTYNYLHLPLIDFLPYKVGVNLLSEVEATTSNMEYSVVLVYRNIVSGELCEFSIDDTQWHDDTQWEWVETHTDIMDMSNRSQASDFMLSRYDGEVATTDVLSNNERVNILGITNVSNLRAGCKQRIESYIDRSEKSGVKVVVMTPAIIDSPYLNIEDHQVEVFNIDPTTLKSILRTPNGVVEFNNGVIESKRSCIDL
ncbi:MAG: BT_3928 family protein [Rikenellaceae bacterium]